MSAAGVAAFRNHRPGVCHLVFESGRPLSHSSFRVDM